MTVKEFQLLLKPTSYDCNLDCTYCFYKKTNKIYPVKNPRMNDEVLEILIKKFLKFRFENSVFCWQGGEPSLMGLDFFKKVVQLQQKYGNEGQKISNSFQTNGTLLDKNWAEFFKKYNFLIGVSLDGNQKMHNTYRKFKNKSPSWQKVMNSLYILQKYNVDFNILCVISKANINDVENLYSFFIENGYNYLQFIPPLECIDNKMASFSPTSEEYGNFLCKLFDLWKDNDYNTVYIRTFAQVLSAYLGIPPSCPFDKTCAGYLVVEWNGDVYPCDFFVKNKFKLGNILQDDFSTLLEKKEKIFSSRKSKISIDCYNCHWKDICWGGCLKDRYFCDNPDKSKTYFCSAYKKFFTHSYKWFTKMQIKIQMEKKLPYKSFIKKINRNDPCPCGSGLKYKKCHGKY
ncbi:MAG: anaerobic sulfatase maturase [Candidatus Helarchaeota archaeon]